MNLGMLVTLRTILEARQLHRRGRRRRLQS